MAEWTSLPLSDLATPDGLVGGPFGSLLVGRDYVEAGVPVIRGENLNHGRSVSGEFVYVTRDKFDRDLARSSAAEGDLIFTQRGTLGQVAMIESPAHVIYAVSQSQMRLRVDESRADALYIYYACRSPLFQRQLADHAISTGVPHINLGILRKLTVPVPPVTMQRAIAEVLGALDDKIAANTRLVDTADHLAATTFASLLTGATSVPLSSVAQFVNGKAFTKDATGTGRVVVRIAELNSGIGGSTVYNDIEVSDQHVARPSDILFAWSGSLTLHRWYRSEAIVNQHIFKVIPNPDVPRWLVWGLIATKLQDFRAIAADKATTMGHIQRHHLDEPVVMPHPEVVSAHDDMMSSLWTRALAAEQENLTLIETRDALLPALMSGTLRVDDAEHIVENVT